MNNLPANGGDSGLVSELGRSPGAGNGNPFQYSCLGNPMDIGAWWATVHGVAKSQTQLSTVQTLSPVQRFLIPWTAAHLVFLSVTISWSLSKLMSVESGMPSNHLILCHPLLLLSSIFPNIRVFSNETVLHIRWPKYWSFSFSLSPSNG